jgi:hypothetical protein
MMMGCPYKGVCQSDGDDFGGLHLPRILTGLHVHLVVVFDMTDTRRPLFFHGRHCCGLKGNIACTQSAYLSGSALGKKVFKRLLKDLAGDLYTTAMTSMANMARLGIEITTSISVVHLSMTTSHVLLKSDLQ